MKKIIVLFADGTEEIEALTPVDVLKRAGAEVDIVSLENLYPIGSHKITVKADKLIGEVKASDYDAIVVPGGMVGSKNISENEKAISLIKEFESGGNLVCSICASPAVVIAKHGICAGKKSTCYPAPDFISLIKNYTGKDVEVDGNLITADGIKSAFSFSLAICKALGITPRF